MCNNESSLYKRYFTPILIQYAPFGGRNDWIGPVTFRIFDAKRCKEEKQKVIIL